MAGRIEFNVEKIYDRGPKYGIIEAQVTFEHKDPTGSEEGGGFAQVIVLLSKVKVGKMSFEEIRAMALAKAVSFMAECVKSAAAANG